MLWFVVFLNCVALYWEVFLACSVIHIVGLIYVISSSLYFHCPVMSQKNNKPGNIMRDSEIVVSMAGRLWRWVCHTSTVMTAPWCQKTENMAWIRLLEISEEQSGSNGSDPNLYLDNRTVVWSYCWEISPQTDSLINDSQREDVIPLTALAGLQECVLEPWNPQGTRKPS